MQARLRQPTSAGFNLAILSLLVVFALPAFMPIVGAARMATLLPIADGRAMLTSLLIGAIGFWALPHLSRA